ncbi:MAG: SufS family cysteine desulfurase [Candidatus Diapherotrites archaeon]|nr:SufS family cysteine desulfurase [Candidatus Diapherotrites archaeon]
MISPKIRDQFPILQRRIRDNKPLVYLDNAATTQKPRVVIDAMSDFYLHHNANVHRGIHQLSEEASIRYEEAHQHVAHFINAPRMENIVFTRGTTDSLNMLARMLSSQVKRGDSIVVSGLEHHSNLIPWQQLARAKKAKLRILPIDKKDGTLDESAFSQLIDDTTKIVSIAHASNLLGTILPIQKITQRAHDVGAYVSLDAAQSVGHFPVDVHALGVDFASFSSHKMYGPTGIGVLYGQKEHLETLPPVSFGGEMVREVTYETATWNNLPWRFEAGTPPIAEAIGLDAAVQFLSDIGMAPIRSHEKELVKTLLDDLAQIPTIQTYGPSSSKRVGLVAFNVDGVHPHDLASLLDHDGIAVRAGHHCAMPLTRALGLSSSVRASLGLYSQSSDVAALVRGVKKAQGIFARG